MGGGDKPMPSAARTVLEASSPELDRNATSSFSMPMVIQRVCRLWIAGRCGHCGRISGPLAGILATGLDRAPIVGISWVFSAAAVVPSCRAIWSRAEQARWVENAQLAVAASGGWSHPVIGLWSVSLRDELLHALVQEDVRRIDRWTARYKLATVTWPTEPLDPFFNANTMDDIAEAERLAELDGG
jgi:molybdopterin-guanine dinucleotide biosynthesis protein A